MARVELSPDDCGILTMICHMAVTKGDIATSKRLMTHYLGSNGVSVVLTTLTNRPGTGKPKTEHVTLTGQGWSATQLRGTDSWALYGKRERMEQDSIYSRLAY